MYNKIIFSFQRTRHDGLRPRSDVELSCAAPNVNDFLTSAALSSAHEKSTSKPRPNILSHILYM